MTRGFALCLGLVASTLSGCSRPASDAPAAASATAPLAASSAAPAAAPSASGVAIAQVANGDEISIQQLADGRVVLKTKTLWGAPLDTTYENCTFYRGALPVLKRQLSEDRGRVLDSICPEPPKDTR